MKQKLVIILIISLVSIIVYQHNNLVTAEHTLEALRVELRTAGDMVSDVRDSLVKRNNDQKQIQLLDNAALILGTPHNDNDDDDDERVSDVCGEQYLGPHDYPDQVNFPKFYVYFNKLNFTKS